MYIYIYLVGGIPTPLKNMKVSWDYYSPKLYVKIKIMFQSPPTSNMIHSLVKMTGQPPGHASDPFPGTEFLQALLQVVGPKILPGICDLTLEIT